MSDGQSDYLRWLHDRPTKEQVRAVERLAGLYPMTEFPHVPRRFTWEYVEGALHPGICELLCIRAGDQPIVMPHRTMFEFMRAMRDLAPLARKHLGPDISGLGSSYYSVAAGLSTHTDNDYVQALPGTFLSVWVALADVTERNGPLVIEGQARLCKKGDALVFDGDLPHRSCAGEGPRPVALFTYIKTGMPFRPGTQQKREEVPV